MRSANICIFSLHALGNQFDFILTTRTACRSSLSTSNLLNLTPCKTKSTKEETDKQGKGVRLRLLGGQRRKTSKSLVSWGSQKF